MVNRQRPRPEALLLVCVALASACGGGGGTTISPATTVRPETIEITDADRLYRDDRAQIDSTGVVVRDMATYQSWWDRATEHSGEPIKTVNFDTHFVLVVGAGLSRPGDRIEVQCLRLARQEEGGDTRRYWEAVVHFTPETDPFGGATYPVQLVRVPRVSEPIRFVAGECT